MEEYDSTLTLVQRHDVNEEGLYVEILHDDDIRFCLYIAFTPKEEKHEYNYMKVLATYLANNIGGLMLEPRQSIKFNDHRFEATVEFQKAALEDNHMHYFLFCTFTRR